MRAASLTTVQNIVITHPTVTTSLTTPPLASLSLTANEGKPRHTSMIDRETPFKGVGKAAINGDGNENSHNGKKG